MNRMQEKLLVHFDEVVENGPKFNGSLKDIDYFSTMTRAAEYNTMYSVKGRTNVHMLNCRHEGKDAVLMIFSIPLSSNNGNSGGKQVVEKIMDILQNVEECFTTLDYSHSEEVKSDNFAYLTFVKALEN